MPTVTPKGFSVPVGSDNNDNVDYITGIAERMEEIVSGMTTSNITALSGVDLWLGRTIFNTTTREFWWYDGDTWQIQGFVRGEIREYPVASGSPPPGWLWAEGGVANIADHPFLADIYGTTFGGNGTTTFGLPNRKGRVGVGMDTNVTQFNDVGKTGGSRDKTLQTSEIPSHQHTANHNHSASSSGSGSHDHTGTTQTSGSHKHTVNSHKHSNPSVNSTGPHQHGAGPGAAGHSENSFMFRRSTYSGSQRSIGTYEPGTAPSGSGWSEEVAVVWYTGSSDTTAESGGHAHSQGDTGNSSPQTNTVSSHNHSFTTSTESAHSHGVTVNTANVTTSSVGSDASFSLMNPFFVTRYIVKA